MIYIWFLLTLPQDRLICELWTRQIPDKPALVRACGTDELEAFRLDVTRGGVGICSIPAASLPWVVTDCALPGLLDEYRLRIVKPDHQELMTCTVTMTTDAPPSPADVWTQCNVTDYELRFGGTRQPTPEPVMCKPPPISQPQTIATQTEYHILAGKLIWYGYAKSACPNGYSGVDPVTFAATPCGMDGARPAMLEWQNQLDASILQSARAWNVPASLLKQLIADETQFWTWTGVDDEHGLIQITDAGAHLVMHAYQPGYYKLSSDAMWQTRQTWLRALDCDRCTPKQTIEHAAQVMDRYAQALSAYYCMYGSWDEALRAWNIKHSKEN